MKDMFPSYYSYSDDEFKEIVENAVFVFDTNILLNLYRYKTESQKVLLNGLTKLKKVRKIWIPHHVALEYQRNRLKVIIEQYEKFSQVKKTIKDKFNKLKSILDKDNIDRKHSTINPEPFIKDINSIKDKYFKELDELKQKSSDIRKEDTIRNKLDKLFKDCIGKPFKSQDEIDSINTEGEMRVSLGIPPGYCDDDKKKGFMHDGIMYKSKLGDFIIWKQIINYLKNLNQNVHLIFVTDDSKEDWWYKLKYDDGEIKIPRPELVEEIYIEAKAKFQMYNMEGFLDLARSQLEIDFSDEIIDEARKISEVGIRVSQTDYRGIEQAVFNWLSFVYNDVVYNRVGYPDFIVKDSGLKIGFDVKFISTRFIPQSMVGRIFNMIKIYLDIHGFDKFNIIFVFSKIEDLEIQFNTIEFLGRKHLEGITGVSFLFGIIDNIEINKGIFDLRYEIQF